MRTFSITALILILTASPAGAAMVTVQDGDNAARCRESSARLVVDYSEDSSVSPQELSPCGQTGNESGAEERTAAIGNASVNGRAAVESSPEIATLFGLANE